MSRIINIIKFFIIIIFIGCNSSKDSEWIYMFDGKTTDGWRGYNKETLPKKWEVINGELTFNTELKLEKDWDGGNDIIYYKEQFENFELYLEWKLPKGGNSGVFYHVQEGYNAPHNISPEYQILDDDGWEEINNAKLKNWQTSSRIIHDNNKVEHWVNGKIILSFFKDSDDCNKKRNSEIFRDKTDYGKFKKGYIALQDHDTPIWFRNIRIKKL